MLAYALVFLSLTSIVQSRVSFIFSEVLDTDDFLGTNGASFQCEAGCRIYSPTPNDEVIIYDSTGRPYYSLKDLSELKLGEYYELPARSNPYRLIVSSMGTVDPPFVFYVIEKGAKNYDTKVLYLTDETTEIDVRHESLLTVMSTTGAVYFSNFAGDFTDYLPTVHATGFDSLSLCRPVYKARTAASVLNTFFPVYSPIATIDFTNSWGGKSVRVSGNPNGPISTGVDTTSIFSSPGYVGCGTEGRYSWPPKRLDGFDSSFTVQNDNGLTVHIDGDYSIYSEGGEVELSVNQIEQTLNGTDHSYALEYDPLLKRSPVQIGVKWERQNWTPDRIHYSQDTFALQIDVTSKPRKQLPTTVQPETTVRPTTRSALISKSQPENVVSTTASGADNLETTTIEDTTGKSDGIVHTTEITVDNEDKTTKSGEHVEVTTSSRSTISIIGSVLLMLATVLLM